MALPRWGIVTALLVAGVALLLWAGLAWGPRMQAGGGVVLDTSTDQPVPGAEVTLDCQRGTGFHTTEQVRLARTMTDAAGRYRFESRDVAGCDFAFVHVSKAGYADAAHLAPRYAYTDYARIPAARYLTPVADAGMVRLVSLDSGPRQQIFPAGRLPTAEEQSAPPNESAAHEYDRLFEAFYRSKWIAATGKETEFVIERYCARMSELYAQMTEADRESVLAHVVSYETIDSASRTLHMGPRDHATEVLPYCNSRGAIKSPYVYTFGRSSSCLVILENPTRLRNMNCKGTSVHVSLAFNHEGVGVESATLAPGQEYAAKTQDRPRTAECPSGSIAVTAAGRPWVGIDNMAFCRAPSEQASSR